MENDKDVPKGTFKLDDGKLALIRCPECDRENYAPNVISGICTWCGFDANACPTCEGEGLIDISDGDTSMSEECPHCKGK